jgi:hypothetical protein
MIRCFGLSFVNVIKLLSRLSLSLSPSFADSADAQSGQFDIEARRDRARSEAHRRAAQAPRCPLEGRLEGKSLRASIRRVPLCRSACCVHCDHTLNRHRSSAHSQRAAAATRARSRRSSRCSSSTASRSRCARQRRIIDHAANVIILCPRVVDSVFLSALIVQHDIRTFGHSIRPTAATSRRAVARALSRLPPAGNSGSLRVIFCC